MLKKRDMLVNKVKSRCQKNIFKFGVEVPLRVEDALRTYWVNCNTLWNDSIGKEMNNSRVDFNSVDRDNHASVGNKEITCHVIFDVKMDLTRKSRYVAVGHITNLPSFMTYVSLVSRDSVCLAFLIIALNGLDILAGDINNAHLNSPTIWGELIKN